MDCGMHQFFRASFRASILCKHNSFGSFGNWLKLLSFPVISPTTDSMHFYLQFIHQDSISGSNQFVSVRPVLGPCYRSWNISNFRARHLWPLTYWEHFDISHEFDSTNLSIIIRSLHLGKPCKPSTLLQFLIVNGIFSGLNLFKLFLRLFHAFNF